MKNQIVFKNHENGYKIAKILLDEGNVVMLSYEEQFLVLNWEYGEDGYADRNCVVFMPRDEYEDLGYEYSEGVWDEVTEAYLNNTLGDVLAPRIAKWKKDISSI